MRVPAFWPGLLALIVLADCARPVLVATIPPAGPPSAPFSAGTILSMRAIAASVGSPPWRAALLAAASGESGSNDQASALTEFIVRADDGATLSIVQSNQLDLHTGDRVVIRYERTTRLVRPS